MRLRDIRETSDPIIIQEEDIQSKINSKRSTRFCDLEELPTVQFASSQYILRKLLSIYGKNQIRPSFLCPTQRLLLMSKVWSGKMIKE